MSPAELCVPDICAPAPPAPESSVCVPAWGAEAGRGSADGFAARGSLLPFRAFPACFSASESAAGCSSRAEEVSGAESSPAGSDTACCAGISVREACVAAASGREAAARRLRGAGRFVPGAASSPVCAGAGEGSAAAAEKLSAEPSEGVSVTAPASAGLSASSRGFLADARRRAGFAGTSASAGAASLPAGRASVSVACSDTAGAASSVFLRRPLRGFAGEVFAGDSFVRSVPAASGAGSAVSGDAAWEEPSAGETADSRAASLFVLLRVRRTALGFSAGASLSSARGPDAALPASALASVSVPASVPLPAAAFLRVPAARRGLLGFSMCSCSLIS